MADWFEKLKEAKTLHEHLLLCPYLDGLPDKDKVWLVDWFLEKYELYNRNHPIIGRIFLEG